MQNNLLNSSKKKIYKLARKSHLLLRSLLYVLSSSHWAMLLMLGIILLQLSVGALALSNRLSDYINRIERSQARALEIATTRAAALEASSLSDALPGKGAAAIGAPPQQKDQHSTSPSLQARDIESIIEQETTALADALAEEDAQRSLDNQQPEEEANTAELSDNQIEQQAELDRLVRDGVAALIAGDMRRSILNFEQAYSINPKHPAMLYYYGMAFDKILNPSKAREYYNALYALRNHAGIYFEKAARRITYGFITPEIMRGKLAFGPQIQRHRLNSDGECVSIILPILLAQGEEIRPEDIYIHIQFFDLVNSRKIQLSRQEPSLEWESGKPEWSNPEEKLLINYNIVQQGYEEHNNYADTKYYGFTAKLYYKGEPMDCISSPSALILHENRLRNKSNQNNFGTDGLLPYDDGLNSNLYEEAIPISDEDGLSTPAF